jgi:hypothetical protein
MFININFAHRISTTLYRFLNERVAQQLTNFPFLVNIMIELETIIHTEKQTTQQNNNTKQEHTTKVNTFKAIPKYYSGVLVVSTFSFSRFSKISLFCVCHYCIQ